MTNQRKKTLKTYTSGIINFFSYYFFGLSKVKVQEIITEAKNYDYVFIDRSVFGIIAKRTSGGKL